MPIGDIFKVTRKTFLNPNGWIDADNIKLCSKTIWGFVRPLFTTPKAINKETFEQAMDRLGLTEEDVVSSAKKYRQYAFAFLLLSLLAFIYSFYLLFSQTAFFDWLLGMAVTGLFLSQAFRFDFWAFQMKRRQLGATFNEWKNDLLGNGKGT